MTDLVAGLSEASFALLIISNCGIKMFFPEVRPSDFGKIQFRVCKLIEKEIADAVFAAGPDHEFRIGKLAGREKFLKRMLIDLFDAESSFFHFEGDVLYCVQ